MENSNPVLQSALVPAHEVPPPTSISSEARTYLSAAAMSAQNRAYPALDDRAGWKALITEMEQWIARAFCGAVDEHSVEREVIWVGEVPIYVAVPPSATGGDRAYLDIHGGALIYGAGDFCRRMGILSALKTGVITYSVDYRMAPDHPYPTALDDCMAAYRALLGRYSPERIVVGGGSAGGNLAAALMLRARDEDLPLPAGLVLMTPEIDLTESGDSFRTNIEVDVVLRQGLAEVNALYADGHDLAHPYLSPLFGDFAKGFPRTFLQTGTRDIFLSNTVRMHRALLKAGVEVELHVFEAMPHGGFGGAPEDIELAAEVRRFVEECWH